jgi:hypothetical protein
MEKNLKTKLFSLGILAVLVVPVFMQNTPKAGGSGNVLGVNEKKEMPAASAQFQAPQLPNIGEAINSITKGGGETPVAASVDLPQYKLKDISSGIRDVRNKTASAVELRGKVTWNANAKTAVVSGSYGIGSGLKVVNGEKVTNVVVGDAKVLSPDVLIEVDQATFVQLGGNLEKDLSLDVVITSN